MRREFHEVNTKVYAKVLQLREAREQLVALAVPNLQGQYVRKRLGDLLREMVVHEEKPFE
jgi:hypothetical protein